MSGNDGVLDVEVVAERAVARLGENAERLRTRSRWLADQIERAAGSLLLNLGEQRHNTRGNRRLRLETAAGSASELRRALRFARLYRHLDDAVCEEIDRDLDRVLAMIWRMRQRCGT
ncbi:four helix bundle protein [Sandaracinus amylolyticus]|uniref:four helix bundle protein n=1 Tax=Sandaracinus amylolyticus TaxID=927083 RepID=UPI001F37DC9A|nr:four helix bundle protein [Sandaracinus amylolyticus]UJR85564.1 Hypothetical protein I5071_76440 [Sandaracinus amylolyticus]